MSTSFAKEANISYNNYPQERKIKLKISTLLSGKQWLKETVQRNGSELRNERQDKARQKIHLGTHTYRVTKELHRCHFHFLAAPQTWASGH